MTNTLPKLLKQDAILESLVELQFEHNQVAEVVLGRLAAFSHWATYQSLRLPIAELPQGIRDADPNIRYQPILQLQNSTGTEVVKIGPRVISVHRLAGYPGWQEFRERVALIIDALTEAAPEAHITRVGLRYVNAILPEHGFKDFWDLNLALSVDGNRPAETVAANYRYPVGDNRVVQVGVAHPVYVQGPFTPPGAIALIDVDVYSVDSIGSTSKDFLMEWVENSHNAEKEAFFRLWPSEQLASQRID